MEDAFEMEEFSLLCRLCLCDKRESQDVFAFKSHNDERNMLLSEKIFFSTSIDIKEADELPTLICQDCCEQVEKIYNFKQKCLATDSILRKRLNWLKHKERCDEPPSNAQPGSLALQAGVYCSSEDDLRASDTDNHPVSTESEDFDDVPVEEFKYDPEMLDVEIKEEGELQQSPAVRDLKRSKAVGPIYETVRGKRKSSSRMSYICHPCGKVFGHKYSLNRHLITHSQKTFSCQYCSKVFKNNESMQRHEKIHFGQKRYQCDLCDKSYISSTSYAAHVRKHTGERPFECSECGESFSLITSFERHAVKHTGVREYVCEICSSSFWVADDLRAHVNRSH